MKALHRKAVELVNAVKKNEQKGALEGTLEDLFHDMYRSRRRIYHMNFVRGIFFGAGSAIGGTLIIGVIIWLLSLFVNFPFIGDFFKNAQSSIEQSQQSQSE